METTQRISKNIPIPPISSADVAFHVVGVFVNSLITIFGMYWLAINRHILMENIGLIFPLFLIGIFLGDFFSGFLHWLFDTWFTEKSPFLSRMVLIVREHHIYPQNIFNYKLSYEAGSVSWASLAHTLPAIFGVSFLIDEASALTYSVVMLSVMVSFLTLFMLQFHKLGHRKSKNPLIIILQKARLIMSPKHHAKHHQGNHDIKYCLINGWADIVLDFVGFWRILERIIYRITKVEPRANDIKWMTDYGKNCS